jgi:hypothetical protein
MAVVERHRTSILPRTICTGRQNHGHPQVDEQSQRDQGRILGGHRRHFEIPDGHWCPGDVSA